MQPFKLFAWDATTGQFIRVTADASGALNTTAAGGGGGGGAVTVADGADVAQGSTGDVAGTNTVLGKLKAIAAALAGTLNVNVGNFPGTQPVSGSVSVSNFPGTQPVSGTVTADTELPAATALADTDGNPTTSRVGANGLLWNGTSWDRAPGDKTNGLKVQSAQLPASLDGSGFLKVHDQGTVTADVTPASPLANDYLPVRLTDGAAFYVAGGAGGGAVTVADGADVAQGTTSDAAWVSGNGTVIAILKKIATTGPGSDVSDRAGRLLGHVDGTVANAVADAGNPVKVGGKATWPAVPTLVATGQRVDGYADLAGAQIIRKRPLASYSAIYRLADATAAQRLLSTGALTANVDKQIATIYHAVGATKRVQIKFVGVQLYVVSVAGTVEFEIVPLSATTAPATGNPAITPGKSDQADSAAEATCLALPTTQGSVVAVNSPVGMFTAASLGITGAAATTQPPPIPQTIVLWDSRGDTDGKDLIMRPATAEGYAVICRCSAAATLTFALSILFTEE